MSVQYVAFLRAINVGGHTVRMEDLRRLFEKMGAAHVETFIASGNVIFESAARPSLLEPRLETGLEKALKFPVATFLRTVPEVARIAQTSPFPDVEAAGAGPLHVGFLKSAPSAALRATVAAASTPAHRFAINDREVYWLRVDAAGEYESPKLEKTLGPMTFRNITTIRKLAAKYARTLVLLLALAALPHDARAQQSKTLRPDLGSAERIADWTLDGTGSWEVTGGTLRLVKAGTPGGPIRRPAALAILNSAPYTTVTLEAEIKSTAPVDLPVRDVELIFGYESPTRFYYVHLAGITNAVHNGIFVVNGADRRRLDEPDSVPQMKDQAWHRVRLERDPATGRIEIFVDGSTTPALKATDTTIAAGRIGFGSFDETGEFRNIVVKGAIR